MNVEGTSNPDRIGPLYVDPQGDSVSEENDFVQGFEANDTIFGLGGADILDGGLGDDILSGDEGNDSLFGGAGDDALNGGTGGDQLNGGDGNNTADYNSSSAGVTVDLLFGITVGGDASGDILFGIENLKGSIFEDDLRGDNDANTLIGGAGNDVFEGRGGADVILGRDGLDTAMYLSSASGVAVSLLTNSGEGDTLSEIENLIGSRFGDTLTGDNNANTLNGDAGDDILIGGGGADVMLGVSGNDTYREVDGSDIVDEGIGGGSDTVEALVSFSLVNSAQVLGAIENLILLGTANINGTGNFLANVITGNSGANVLAGGSGDDRLDGGTGADRMLGGLGADLYSVDNPGDVADETGGDGIDGVSALVSFVLGAGLENLTLIGGAAINGTGNALANKLTGNAAANTLDGLGGADLLRGGAGNDAYVVDNASDVVDESVAGSGGVDTVRASVSFSLSDGAHALGFIETLTLIGAATNATGNGLANVLTGNAAANVLDGVAGADTLRGLGGNDAYVVDNAGDVVDESVAGSNGSDTVRSAVSFSLADAAHAKGAIENLTLIGGAAVNGTGNAGANTMIGNTAANILAGNLGNDVLTGASGGDFFVFDTKPNKTANVDHVTDMIHLTDFIELDHTIFSKIKIGTGHLKKSAFFAHDGAHKAHDSSDRIIYDKTSGALYYDKDGAGGHRAKVFAYLDGSPDDISAKDFLIVA